MPASASPAATFATTAQADDVATSQALFDKAQELTKQGKWAEMGELIDDEVLTTFAIVAEPEGVAPELRRRYGDAIQRISFYAPYASDPDRWQGIIAALRAA